MANYQKLRVKLANRQLKKSKSAAKNKTKTTLKITKKNFKDEELPHELFLTTKLTTNIRNTIGIVKLRTVQLSKMIKPIRFLCDMSDSLGNIGKKVIRDLAVPLARDNIP